MEASLKLQRMLVAALEASSAFQAAGLRVHDGPPADAQPPYVSLGPDSCMPWGWKGGGGHEHRVTLTAWLGRGGMAGAKQLLAIIEAAILAAPRSHEGLRIVQLRPIRSSVKRNPKSWTEGRIEYLARTTED
ncbi:MAG: DUF3168 domain-containing protein [Sphingomonadaceae bacterium]